VACNCGEWKWGTVIKHHYREADWEEGKTVPYQVLLDGGELIYAPEDTYSVIRGEGDPGPEWVYHPGSEY
jgi:hypothetical protein